MAATDKPAFRLLVTLLLPAVAWGAGFITLPGVNAADLSHIVHRNPLLRMSGLEQLSIVALGLMPALSGFTLVELAALAVPRWRPLRTGGPAGRASLRWSAILVSLGLAAIQGWFVARWLESFSWRYMYVAELIRDPGLGTNLLITLTLVAGTCLLLTLVWLIDRYGIGNGFAVLLASAVVPAALGLGARLWTGVEIGELDLADLIGFLARTGGVAIATWWILTLHRRIPGALRHPTSGALPIATAASLLMLPVTLGNLGLDLSGLTSQPGTRAYQTVNVVLIALLCLGFSWLFFRDARGTRVLWQGIGRSAAFLAAVVLVVTPRAGSAFAPDALLVIGVTAVTMDLVAEWRARVKWGALESVWPVHQVARLDELLGKLTAAGVPVHPRGASYRQLLHFFGPFCPIELMVPAERAAEARALLDPSGTPPSVKTDV